MLPRDLRKIDERLLVELCEQATPEAPGLEFKRELPSKHPKGKAELAKDVSALANAGGGDIIFGVHEKDACANKLNPIVGETADAAQRRLGQVLDAKVEPRLLGLQFQAVPLPNYGEGAFVLVCRVPQSFVGPHRYDDDGVFRFVVRTGTHTTELTYEQLRRAFDRTSSLAEQAERFRAERIGRILSGQIWRRMLDGPICAVHVIPLAAMSGAFSLDISKLAGNYTQFMFREWGGASMTTNLDGLVVYPGGFGERSFAHTQIFRTGALETVRTGGMTVRPNKIIPSATVSSFFRDATYKLVDVARNEGLGGPALIGFALLNVADYKFGVSEGAWGNELPADRDHLILPLGWHEHLESDGLESFIQSQLDVLWQAFTFTRCTLYDPQGNWCG